MWKKAFIFFVLFIIISINNVQASNQVLQLDEDEIDQRSFSRIYNKLVNFYRLNSEQVTKLNAQKFFEDPEHPSALAEQALKEIEKNRKASITQSYFKNYNLLKSHLLKIHGCFKEDQTAEDLDASKITDLLTYTNGLFLILYGLGVR